jgi:hypothetical protein
VLAELSPASTDLRLLSGLVFTRFRGEARIKISNHGHNALPPSDQVFACGMLRTKTFEIKHHLTVIELCLGRASETVGDAQAAGPAAYEADFYCSTSGICVRWTEFR